MPYDRSRPSSDRSFAAWLPWLPVAGILTVPAIVVPAIVGARVAYGLRHPDGGPSDYLTISRAISDPVIGEPFAFWVTLAAIVLWPATHFILWMVIAQHPSRSVLGVLRDRIGRALFPAMSVAMTATCIGMVVLSRHRLGGDGGDHHAHMVGSYIFFAGQAATILIAAVYHSVVGPARRRLGSTAFFSDRWRARLGYGVVVAAALYGVIFVVKSMDLGRLTPIVVAIYIEFETLLIVVFLAYLALYTVDVLRFSRSRFAPATQVDPAPAAGRS